jgi:predicted nucleic acid-binding protein
MGSVRALFDTNILINYRNGVVAARDEIARYQSPSISLISWMEVLVGTAPDEAPPVRGFLRRFEYIGIDTAIAERAVELRQAKRLTLPSRPR